MSRRAAKQALHAATRERILEAATRLFASQGFRRVTVRAISRDAKANLAAVNYHFQNKLGLYTEVVDRAIATMRGTTEQTLREMAGGSAEKRLRHYIRTYLTHLTQSPRDHGWIHRLMGQEMGEPTPAAHRIATRAIRPRIEYLSGVIAELLGCDVADPRVRRGVVAVQMHCLFYGRMFAAPDAFRAGAFPEWPTETPADVGAIADFVADFSLAGLRGVQA